MSDKESTHRPVSMGGGGQRDLFAGGRRTPGSRRVERVVGFDDRDPHDIFIGEERLDRYLVACGRGWVMAVRSLLRTLDWGPFEARYKLTGRRPYAPVAMVGLILYGLMQGKNSLRELETLARMDLGAMWLTGGICPDHASLGRFIQLHEGSLTTSFFEDLTRAVLAATGASVKVLAGDATVVEAAGSRYRKLRKEAAVDEAKQLRAQAEASPEDQGAQKRAQRADAVVDALEERAKARKGHGGDTSKTQACATEPEAPILKSKRGTYAPSYVPSVMSTEERVIVAQHVETTDELAAVPPMLDQAQRVGGEQHLETVLFDGNYSRGPVLNAAVERDLSILCPVRRRKNKEGSDAKLGKESFRYDVEDDSYICPAGNRLRRSGTTFDKRRGHNATVYASNIRDCRICPLRDQCIGGKKEKRRRIRRFEHDDAAEALPEVMKQPKAQALLNKRKAMVEPVYSDLRGVQNLNRFRRFGLAGVRLEFALHACAHNLRRFVALGAASSRSWYAWLLTVLWTPLLALLVARRYDWRHHRTSAVADSQCWLPRDSRGRSSMEFPVPAPS